MFCCCFCFVLFFPPTETGQPVSPVSDTLLPGTLFFFFALLGLPSDSSGLLSIMISEQLCVLCSENPPCFLLLGNPLPAAIEEMCGGGKRWDSEDEWLWPTNR